MAQVSEPDFIYLISLIQACKTSVQIYVINLLISGLFTINDILKLL